MSALRFLRKFMRHGRRDDGAASLEFVIAVPVVLMILFSGIEVGIVTLRQVMLERGVDMTVRSLRLGQMNPVTLERLRVSICDNAIVIPACRDNLMVEMQQISMTTFALPSANTRCVDRGVATNPALDLTPGVENDIMLIRACLLYDPLFPTTGLGLGLPVDQNGVYRLLSASFYVNEPS